MIKKLINNINKTSRKNKLQREKDKLYIKDEVEKKSFSRKKRKDNFSLFKTKLELPYVGNKLENTKYIVYYGIGLFLFFGSFYLAFFSPYFKVQEIIVENPSNEFNINSLYSDIGDFYYKSIFLTDKNIMKYSIISTQPSIKDVKIRRILPKKIIVNIIPYNSLFSTTIAEANYILLENGTLIPGTTEDKNIKPLKIHFRKDENFLGFLDYKKIFSDSDMEKIIEIIGKTNNEFLLLKISSIDFFPVEKELHLNLDSKTKLIFSLNIDINSQFKKLTMFHKETFDLTKHGLIYIDLRVNKKIFYCNKEEQENCNDNLKRIYNYNI